VGIALQYPESQIYKRSVSREVAFGPGHLGLDRAEVARRVQWALEMVGLNGAEMSERVPFTLSGGEMRRVALASALAMRPEVLILDEPTAGLDPRGRRDLLGRILDWQRRAGSTLIVVSHDQDQLARLAERVVVLSAGALAADGPAQGGAERCGAAAPAGARRAAAGGGAVGPARCTLGGPDGDRLLPEQAVTEILGARSPAGGWA